MMITIFNGRKRTLGGKTQEVYAQVGVDFREHLHALKGAKLHVFLAIALHANEHGWAWPSYKKLERETGYGRNTIARALSELCELTINGHRVLLRFQPIAEDGTYQSNRYLIFPSDEEVKQFEKSENEPCTKNSDTVEPCTGFRYTEKPYTENVDTKHNHVEEQTDMVHGGDNNKNKAITLTLLTGFGVSQGVAHQLAEKCDPDYVQEWIKYTKQAQGLRNPIGFLVSKLKAGEAVPDTKKNGGERRRDIDGKYAKYIKH
jgi:hypothetical protein